MTGTIEPGQTVIFRSTPHSLRQYQGKTCEVIGIDFAQDATLARLRIDNGTDTGVEVSGVSVHFLAPAPAEPKRRSPLNLRVVKDNRSEAQIQADIVSWFKLRDYIVHAPDGHRSAAVCWDCHREARAENPAAKPRPLLCPTHRHPVYSPDTGGDEGIPDLHITHERWPECAWTVMEIKKDEKADRRPAQVDLASKGRSVFIWSLRMAQRHIYDFERRIGIEPLPELVELFADAAEERTAA